MKRVLIIGGETHISEVTSLRGERLEIVGAAVREDQLEAAQAQFECEVGTDYVEMLTELKPDLAAIANENDLKAEAVVECLQRGVDVVVDKPFAITLEEQMAVEEALAGGARLLHLLTLRGDPQYRGLQEVVRGGGGWVSRCSATCGWRCNSSPRAARPGSWTTAAAAGCSWTC